MQFRMLDGLDTGGVANQSFAIRIFPSSRAIERGVHIGAVGFLEDLSLRKFIASVAFSLLLLVGFSAAQQIDIGFGMAGIHSPSGGSATVFSPPGQGGGVYLGFNGDFLLKKNLGVQGEIFWKASQGLYNGYQPYRPLFWDFNGIWLPPLAKHVTGELVAGIGVESIRFYNNFLTCSYITGCTNYTSSNHFMGDFGGGIRFYPIGNFFVRPEARFYLIHNNVEFNSNHATRYGVTIGYTFP
jgi:hypothetical protein